MAAAIPQTITNTETETYNRTKEIKLFEESRIGVKGLVDSGSTSIPRFFIHPMETINDIKQFKLMKNTRADDPGIIPVIDLSGAESEQLRPGIVEKVAHACREFGFFQIVNHGIRVDVLEHVLGAFRGFFELPPEEKAPFYDPNPKRDWSRAVSLFTNLDIFYSRAASWRDTLHMRMSPSPPKHEEFPESLREMVLDWNKKMTQLGELLMELLCEGLGVATGRMKDMGFTQRRKLIANYYPYCPQPDLTVGIPCHTDPGALAILLQSEQGGLQCKYQGDWVDVKHIPQALVVNIGDLFQILSNDEYVSVDHRALANSKQEARVSTVTFFSSDNTKQMVGPFPELVSSEKPARYRQFPHSDYTHRFLTKELDEKTLINYYRV